MLRLHLISIVVVAGCMRSPSKQPAGPDLGRDGSARREIDQLDRQIADEETRLDAGSLHVVPMTDPQVCKPAATDRCTQACTLKDSICKASERICELAKQLGADAYANERCTARTESCKNAREACCGCT